MSKTTNLATESKSYVMIIVNNEQYLAPSTEVEESSHQQLTKWKEQKVTESELYDLHFLLGMDQYVEGLDRENPYYGLWNSKTNLPQMIDAVYVITDPPLA